MAPPEEKALGLATAAPRTGVMLTVGDIPDGWVALVADPGLAAGRDLFLDPPQDPFFGLETVSVGIPAFAIPAGAAA